MSDATDVVHEQPAPRPQAAEATSSAHICELFPTRTSVFVFTFYVSLCSTQYVLVKASQTGRDYTYNTTSVVFITELCKLLIAAALCLKAHPVRTLISIAVSRWRLLLLYLIPSILYCISNNLVFINLRHFEPTTYNVLQQLKIVLTGLLFQTILKKKLSPKQWFAIILLTAGCVCKQLGATQKTLEGFHELANLQGVLLFVQIGCTALSGVCNESLIKTDTEDLHIMIHNVFIYVDSILCNFAVLACRGSTDDLVDPRELSNIFGRPLVLAVVVNGAVGGIMVSLFLKHFDSIVRVFTGSMEMALMAVVCWFTFKTPIDVWTVVAIVVVSIATYLYAKEVNETAPYADSNEAVVAYGSDRTVVLNDVRVIAKL